MSQQVITNSEAETIAWNRNEMRITLPDLEQVIIEAPATCKTQYVNGQWVRQFSEPRQFRVTTLEYALNEDSSEFSLVSVTGNFFLKNSKRVGTRDSYLHHEAISKELLEQIPDELHRYAREYMANTFVPMFSKVIANGIVVKPYN